MRADAAVSNLQLSELTTENKIFIDKGEIFVALQARFVL